MKFEIKTKYFLVSVLFLLLTVKLNAQVMLPAFQAVNHYKNSIKSPIYNALDFDGTNDYATVPSGVYFNGNFTIETWVYPKSYSNWGRIIDFGNGPSNNVVFLAFSTGTSGYPNFRIENSQFQSSTQLPLNTWSHLAATLSGNTATIYINGVSAGSATLVAPPNVVRTNNLIGFSNWTVDDKSNVILDDLRIWDVARTQLEIQNNMNKELIGTESGLKTYYTFNQGIASGDNTLINTIIDKTSNAFNATLTNFAKTGATSNFVTGKVVGESVLLIPKGTYTAITTSGSFPFNSALGGSNVNFTGGDTYSGSTSWGPQQLFDNKRTDYDWCSIGSSQFGQFVFPKSVNISKIFIVPRSQGDQFPSSVTLKVDGVTIGTYTTKSISQADGLGIIYSGNGHYIQPNILGTTWRLEFPATSYIGELEFWGY